MSPSHRRIQALALAGAIALFAPQACAQSGWFPLVLPWDDFTPTAIDASDLLVDYPGQPAVSVVDARGRLRAGGDGHFYFEKTRRRARFFGVNFTFNANFPPCPDEPLRGGEYPDDRTADKVARRLAKLGVNVVRFHHMDTQRSPSGIWDAAYYPNDTQHLDAGQVRRLDWLIYQLRSSGIYVNLNLKVGRRFGPGDGLEDTDKVTSPINYFQGVSHFNPRMIELQKDYARRLLTHRNPYTGKTYAEDPVIAFVEIANEDSLFGAYLNDGGLNYIPGTASLPERYSRELDALWNGWLAGRYATREALETAWRSTEPAGDTSNHMRNPGFESGMAEWSVNRIGSAQATTSIEAGAGPDGSAAFRADVISDGTNWHIQLMQQGHALERDRFYEFSFWARAASPLDITVDIMKGVDPWTNLGLSKSFRLSPSWQKFTARFRANATDPSTVRPTFELGGLNGTVWIDQVEFRRTVPKGLESDEEIAGSRVRRPLRSDLGSYTAARALDLLRFYAEVDRDYFTGMRRFLKEELGVRALVTGTAPWWSYLGDIAVQSDMDFIDGHYYWDHPSWPGVAAWSPTGWVIKNTSWLNSLSDFAGIPLLAVEGKPFTVSEFNLPFPNRYGLEGPLLLALTANLQDWDAIYMFDYASSSSGFAASHTSSFFSIAGNPVKTGQLPVCARIFLANQSSPARTLTAIELARDEAAAGYARGKTNARDLLEEKGLDRRAFLRDRLRLRTFDRADPVVFNYSLPSGGVVSSNGEIAWVRDDPQATWLKVTGRAVQGAIGFVKGQEIRLDDWSFRVAGDESPAHLAVMLQSRDGTALRETRRMILSVWTEHQNTGMVWNSAQTSVDNRWGTSPPLVRPVRLELDLRFAGARSLSLYPLDETGARRGALAAVGIEGGRRFSIDTAADRLVWYEIEINETAAATADYAVSGASVHQLYTDAGRPDLQVGWIEMENRSGPAVSPAALLEYSTRGVLTSLVRLPSASARTLVRAPLLRDSRLNTAVALLSRQPTVNQILLGARDSSGRQIGNPHQVQLYQGEGTAFFVSEVMRDLPPTFEGILEISSPLPFYSLTLRSSNNDFGDFALAPYPPDTAQSGPLYFAHLAADASYSSDILIWNGRTQAISARLDFFNPAGVPVATGVQPASLDIALEPGQLRRIELPRTRMPYYGYARLSLIAGPSLPSATAVLTRWENDAPASEAGMPAVPLATEQSLPVLERPNQQTGLALLNPGSAAVQVELEFGASERSSDPPLRASISLGPGEKKSFFLYQVLAGLPATTTGALRVRCAAGVANLALLGVTNERGEYLMASITGEPGTEPVAAGRTAVMPRFAAGAGYRTLVFLIPAGSDAAQGVFRFFRASSAPQEVHFR